jgi:hypothetical protein
VPFVLASNTAAHWPRCKANWLIAGAFRMRNGAEIRPAGRRWRFRCGCWSRRCCPIAAAPKIASRGDAKAQRMAVNEIGISSLTLRSPHIGDSARDCVRRCMESSLPANGRIPGVYSHKQVPLAVQRTGTRFDEGFRAGLTPSLLCRMNIGCSARWLSCCKPATPRSALSLRAG